MNPSSSRHKPKPKTTPKKKRKNPKRTKPSVIKKIFCCYCKSPKNTIFSPRL